MIASRTLNKGRESIMRKQLVLLLTFSFMITVTTGITKQNTAALTTDTKEATSVQNNDFENPISEENNFDTESMNEESSEIDSQIEVTVIYDTINENYIICDDPSINTSNSEETTGEDNYGPWYSIDKLNLNSHELENNIITVLASNIYNRNGNWFIDCDHIEFYLDYAYGPNDLTATIEAEKDGQTVSNAWYLRNKKVENITFNIAPNADFYICEHWLGLNSGNSANLEKITLEQFSNLNVNMNRFICYLYLDNNVVTKIVEQYTP